MDLSDYKSREQRIAWPPDDYLLENECHMEHHLKGCPMVWCILGLFMLIWGNIGQLFLRFSAGCRKYTGSGDQGVANYFLSGKALIFWRNSYSL